MSGSIHVVVICSECRGLTLAVRVWLGYSSCYHAMFEFVWTNGYYFNFLAHNFLYPYPLSKSLSLTLLIKYTYTREMEGERERPLVVINKGLKPLFLTSFKMITNLHQFYLCNFRSQVSSPLALAYLHLFFTVSLSFPHSKKFFFPLPFFLAWYKLSQFLLFHHFLRSLQHSCFASNLESRRNPLF